MPNVYVIRCNVGNEGSAGYLSIYADQETVQTKQAARHFDSLLSADSYAAALDMQFPGWTHVVETV